MKLENLQNAFRKKKRQKRVGRGPGSGVGKTCGRGQKGAGARAGYRRRYGYEGGQVRLHMKVPSRGFSNAPFRKEYDVVNLLQIEAMFQDGDTVNAESLKARGFISGKLRRIKILGEGELKKKVTIEAHAISSGAKSKLQEAKIPFVQL